MSPGRTRRRSSRNDAEKSSRWYSGNGRGWQLSRKLRRDPRVIPVVGTVLRRFSLDELPQLWNVLRGEMSLVGPRPLPFEEQQQIRGWHRRRISMKPGITGLWQVSGRSEVDFEDWIRLDLRYIDEWSLGLDLRILLRTLPAVLLRRGAR